MILRCTRSMTTPIRHAEQIPDAHQEKGKRCEDEGSVGGPPMICGHAGRCELAVLAYSTCAVTSYTCAVTGFPDRPWMDRNRGVTSAT